MKLGLRCQRQSQSQNRAPEMCCELPAVEGVTAEECKDGVGSVVPAVHPLCLQLQVQLQRLPR